MATKPARKSRRATRKRRNAHISIRAVDFVMYCTHNMARTRAFYQKLFGLKRGHEWNDFWSEFKTEPVTLCLNGPSQRPNRNWHGPAAIALAVQDIHEAIRECRRRKVKVLLAP